MNLKDVENKVKEGWIKSNLIFEVVGFPKEHVEKAMNLVLEKLNDEKDIMIFNQEMHEAKKIGDQMLSSFSEVGFVSKDFGKLLAIIFDYMPSSVEIIEPISIKEDSGILNDLLNDLIAKIHTYDMTLKKMNAERAILVRELSKYTKLAKPQREEQNKEENSKN